MTGLHTLFPSGCRLVMECWSGTEALARFARAAARRAEDVRFGAEEKPIDVAAIAANSPDPDLGGRSAVVSIPLSEQSLAEFVELEERRNVMVECFDVRRDNEVLLEACEVGPRGDDEFSISSAIPEEAIRRLCESVPCLYEVEPDPLEHEEVPEADVWRIEVRSKGNRLEPGDCIRHLPVLFPEGAVLAIPAGGWTSNYLGEGVVGFLGARALDRECVLPVTRDCQEEEMRIRALDAPPDEPTDWFPCQNEEEEREFPDDLQIGLSEANVAELIDAAARDEYLGVDFLYVRIGCGVVLEADFSATPHAAIDVSANVPEERVAEFSRLIGRGYSLTRRGTLVGTELVDPVYPPSADN